MRSRWSRAVFHAVAGSVCLLSGFASAEKRQVIAGRPEYNQHSGFHRFEFGSGYRDLWTTPFEVEVLDLKAFAGGLTPVRQVGSMQSIGLALKGADGESYTFRTLDKDPTKILPAEWQNSWPAKIFQDQTTAQHPGNNLIVPTLAEAAGVPHTTPIYVVMPDDAALGEFRSTFGGKVGMIELYPQPAADGAPGFLGATEILPTAKLWERWNAGEGSVDTQALLRARLFDVFIGDWDRHNGQWRWMRLPDRPGYVPFPEDRDQALSHYSGVALSRARDYNPRFLEWRADYHNLEGILLQGREIDRWLLTGQERQAFVDTARELQGRLTDAAIDEAVRRLPPPWYAKRGAQLARDLKKRRDLLAEVAEAYYRDLSLRPDVHGTDQADVVRVEHGADGSLALALALANAPDRPYFRRRFLAGETKEVRLYLHGGDDRFTSQGRRKGGPTLRVAVGGGNDRLDDAGGGTKFYDVASSDTVQKGSGTSVSTSEWTPVFQKPETPWLARKDFGTLTTTQPLIWWEPDPGVVIAGSLSHYRYGFRKQPYSSMHTFGLEYKTKRTAFRAYYNGDFRWSKPGFYNSVELWSDGAKNYNFYGFGNETSSEGTDEFFKARQELFYAFPSLVSWESPLRRVRLHIGPEFKYARNKAEADTFISQTQPYGFGDFGQLGGRISIDVDTRGRALAPGATSQGVGSIKRPETGIALKLDGYYYPEVGDVTSAYGAADGWLGGYWGAARWLTLAARAGGRYNWGEYPWHDAAFLGGSDTVRGYRRNRFAGDSSLFGNAEARFFLGKVNIFLPLRFGVFGLYDTGRVWLEGETSNKWHRGYGGGIFFRDLVLQTSVDGAVVQGDEGTRFYVGFNFAF
ncbi:MAG TPA: hypothetical protein VKA01_04525 [Vicinamibacteria bacterium]|nr:hypothetical protein [Vicinamibacteria bacterium]